MRVDADVTVMELGEKALIEEVLRPLFNPEGDGNSVGDDCAAVMLPPGTLALFSTDRVPADLISFRAGVLDHERLGRYLGVLNLSDIAACGGTPSGMLFNCALPGQSRVIDVIAIAKGLRDIAGNYGVRVLGGDVTSSCELSLAATVLGTVERDGMLRRSGAACGDSIFVSRAVGLTPAALNYCLYRESFTWLSEEQEDILKAQFTRLIPELELGRSLVRSGICTSCMDNTDGVAQSLTELARESGCAFCVHPEKIRIDPLVEEVAEGVGMSAFELAFSAGADFGLIGTLRGKWTSESATRKLGATLHIIGEVEAGRGLFVRWPEGVEQFSIPGWNYFK